MRTLTVMSHGRESEYRRAAWMICSFFAHLPDYSDYRVIVHTDNPDWFAQRLGNLPVEYRLLTQERVRELKREIQFIHLLKITVVRDLLKEIREPLLYADSDTFFTSSAAPVFEAIGPGTSVLHVREYTFRSMLTNDCPVMRRWGEFLRDHPLTHPDGTCSHVDLDLSSWNAGVMGLDPETLPFFEDIDSMAVQIFLGTGSHASEQYAYSIKLNEETRVTSCEQEILHYYQPYEKLAMDDYLAKLLTKEWFGQAWSVKKADVLARCRALPKQIPCHPQRWRWESLNAFGENRFLRGYLKGLRYLACVKGRDFAFWRDLLYVTRKLMLSLLFRKS